MDRLLPSDAMTLYASAEHAPAVLVRRVCADYEAVYRELAQERDSLRRERQVTHYLRVQLELRGDVCPELEGDSSVRDLVERLVGGPR